MDAVFTNLINKRFKLISFNGALGVDQSLVGTILLIRYCPDIDIPGSNELKDYKVIYKIGSTGPICPGTMADVGDEVI